jgi:hypothetical protein
MSISHPWRIICTNEARRRLSHRSSLAPSERRVCVGSESASGWRGAVPIMVVGLEECSCGLAQADRAVHAYNEEAFRHFLTIERRRSERAKRAFLLLLVSLRKEPGLSVAISPPVASRMFSGLALCVREVDFIGWYRTERIAGAVLTQGAGAPEPDAAQRISERVTEVLGRRLSASMARRLQVRVLQLVGE